MYGQTRIFEWYAACAMVAWAICLVLPGDALSAPQFRVLREQWGGESRHIILMGFIGAVWCAALWVNGDRQRSPFIRAFCCVIGASVWAEIATGIYLASHTAGYISTGFFTYGLMAGFCLFCARRAIGDARLLNS